jgi:radical SAM protein with 4Fe4S-binding SPASM domain
VKPLTTGPFLNRKLKVDEIFLETTNRCNARCIHCAYCVMERERGAMDFELFKRCVDEIGAKHLTKQVSLWGVGEPYLTPDFIKYCAYAIANANTKVVVTTNGVLINTVPEGLDTLVISFNGGTRDSYQKIMRLDFDKTVEKIFALHQAGEFWKAKNVEIHCLMLEDNRGEEQDFLDLFSSLTGVRLRISYKFDNWANHVNDRNISPHKTARRVPCPFALSSLFVSQSGKVLQCPLDVNQEYVIGDVNEASLTDVFDGASKQALIKAHLKGVYSGLCEKCDYNRFHAGEVRHYADLAPT